jgi:hypothetical protein
MIYDNLIIIKGGAYVDIKKALRQWIQLYYSQLDHDFSCQCYPYGHGHHIIIVDSRLDNELFFYLVNYINYPENIAYNVDIEGFTAGKDHQQLKGKRLLVYISPTDTEHDNVFVVTFEQENFKVDFGGKITRIQDAKRYQYPTISLVDQPEIIIKPKQITTKARQMGSRTWHPGKRWNFLVVFVIMAMVINMGIEIVAPEKVTKWSLITGTGVGLWFYMDYKMLQIQRYYLYNLIIAIVYLVFHVLLRAYHQGNMIQSGDLSPLCILLIQLPTRLVIKSIIGREPVIEKPAPSIWDGIYMAILFIGLVLIPIYVQGIWRASLH